MKKKLLIIIGLLLLLVAGVIISAPLLIESQKIQDQLLRRINSFYVVDARVEHITFTWFPFPHAKMENIEVLHQNFSATTPSVILYPSWKILFGISSFGRVDITDPVFQLHDIPAGDGGREALHLNLPAVKLLIKNGTLHLPAQQNSIFSSQKILLRNISASFALHGNKGEFSWESAASFASAITFQGNFDRKGRGAITGDVKDLIPAKILTDTANTLLVPLDDLSTMSFIGTRSPAGTNIGLIGNIPDIAISRHSGTENFRLGEGDLSLHFGQRNTFSIIINNLLVREPHLQIKGEIARYFPETKEQENIKIDLQSTDIDLTALRQKVLTLLGDNSVAQLVCAIVQGGKAHSASYLFDDPVKSFEDVTSMTIKVDIADSDIHLANIPLDLKNAQGPIVIKDGDLTGKDITTWVGDAKGTDGIFLVGLAHDKHGLEVDVDIDANLMELPAVLHTLLGDKNVLAELGMIQASGRAKGHLHIGDDLRDFKVTVDVDRYQDAELRYDRLSWPLRPESGNLQVTDTTVTWQNIKATMGTHSIQESSGHAAWDDPLVPFAITSLHAFFDANIFLGELRQYPLLDEAFAGVIDTVQGSVEVAGALSGPFFEPEKYTYNFDATLKDVTFKTPALPEMVTIKNGMATIGHQQVQIVSSSGSLFGQKINLSGELSHDHWQSWNGNLHVNGLLAANHLSWLTSKDIFPTIIIPRPLYHVPNMNIRWDKGLFKLSGTILSADQTTSLDLDIEDQDNFFSGNFRVKSQTDKAVFDLQWHNKNETFSSSFKGNISGPSLHALIDDANFSFDTITGDFQIQKKQEKETGKALVDFSGDLLGQDIHWQWGKDKRLFTIPILDLASEGSRLKIREIKTLSNDESLAAKGTFSSKPGSGYFELDLTSPLPLTTTNIEKFQEDLDHFLYTTLALQKDPESVSTYEISGLLNFDVDSLVLPFGPKGKKGADALQHPYRLPFTPLTGTYQFNKAESELNLHDSVVCGVGVNGQLTWKGPNETSKKLSMMTPAEAPIEFKDFLTCFNFDGVIEGPLNISGRIYSDTTLCKRGGLLLSSKKGKIKKFVALAKTLSLINITGLSGAIWTEGFYYNALEVSGNICDNIFTIDKAFIDGDGVDIIATGEINLMTMEYDLTFFVVPFATITGLVTKVPLVGRVLGGKEGRIVSVPVKVTGPLDDPKVTVLSPSAIGEATGKWILDTITLPFGWIVPEGSANQKENRPDQAPRQPSTVPESRESTVQ